VVGRARREVPSKALSPCPTAKRRVLRSGVAVTDWTRRTCDLGVRFLVGVEEEGMEGEEEEEGEGEEAMGVVALGCVGCKGELLF